MLLRQSQDASAAFYGVLVRGQNVVVAYRDTKGGQVTSVTASAAALPLYVRASRSGSTFSASLSADGVSWTPLANSTVKLPSFGSPALAGIGASSGGSSLSQASFSSPLVTPGAAVAGLGEQHYYGLDGQRLSDRMDVQANIASGDLVLHGRGLQIAGTGLNLVVDRYYNSLNVANSAGSDFGPGWSMGTGRDVNLTVNGDGSVTFTGPSGYEVTFTQSGGVYVTPTGLDATLVQNGDGTFTLTWHKNGEKFNFNSAGVFTSDVDKNGNTVSFGYNPDGTLNEITDTQGRQVTFSYLSQNGVQLISQMADSTGRLWKYGYDPTTNNLTSYTDPNNKQTSFQYGGPGGLLSQATDPNTNQTNVGYDSTSLEVTQVSFADGSRHSYTYNSGSTVINDALNHATTYGYDSLGRVTSVTDAQSNSTSTTYTADSNVAAFADAKGKTTTFGYDSAGEKLQSVTYPTGAAASWAYNDASHPFYPTSSTDTQGNTLTYTYDANGNQKTTTDQLSSQNQFSANYNANGTVSSTTDARSNSTSYGYDTHGNLTSITPPSPLGGISITPDALSRVHSRVTNIAYADSSSIAYTLDNDGNVSAMTDGIGTTNYGYDGLNRQFQKVPPDRSSANYRYDVAGNLVKVVTCGPAQVWGGPPDGGFIGGTCVIGGGPGGGIIGGRETDYAYNTLNELTSLTDKSDRTTTTFGYDPNHNRTTTTYPNGVAQTTTFDDSQRIASVVATKGASTLSSFTYSYTNPANSHDAMLQYQEVDSVNIITTTNTYDVVNRLTDNLISGSVSKHYQYVYDGNGNRVQQFEDGVSTSYSYNAANEIQTAGTLSYTFDGVGNELGSTQSGSSILSFTYNTKNQPTNVTGTNAGEDMTYTGPDQAERLTLGNRGFNYTLLGMYSETVGAGGLTTFSQVSNTPNLGSARLAPAGASNVKIQTVKQASTVQANTTFYYVTDVQGNILSRSEVDNGTPGPKYYYIHDGTNSIRALVDSSGTIAAIYLYCPTGNDLHQGQNQPYNPWRLASGYYDAATGTQLFLGQSIWDATIGRYAQASQGFAVLMPTPSTSSFSGDGNCLQKFGGGYVVNALECIGQNLLAEPIAISTPAGIIYIQPPFNAAKPGGGEQGDRLRGRDALRRERQKIAFYTRGFTKEMIGAFQRAVEDEKAGFGGDYALPDEELQAFATRFAHNMGEVRLMSTNPRIPADLEDRAAQILGNHLVRIHRLTQRLSTFPWLAHTSESWEPPINEVIPIDSAKQANEILSLFDPARNQMWTALETIGNISGTFSLMQAAEEYWIATFVFPDDPESKWDRYLPTIKTDIVGALRETVLDTLLPIGFFRQTLTWYEKGRLLCGIVNGRPAVW